MGYDDSTNRNDEDNFKEVLRFMDENHLKDVHAIVWTVSPTPRMDAKLQKQANFINQFGDGMIWRNVVIIAKQPGSFNLDQATQGAVEAANLYCSQGNTDPSKILINSIIYLILRSLISNVPQ